MILYMLVWWFARKVFQWIGDRLEDAETISYFRQQLDDPNFLEKMKTE